MFMFTFLYFFISRRFSQLSQPFEFLFLISAIIFTFQEPFFLCFLSFMESCMFYVYILITTQDIGRFCGKFSFCQLSFYSESFWFVDFVVVFIVKDFSLENVIHICLFIYKSKHWKSSWKLWVTCLGKSLNHLDKPEMIYFIFSEA